MRIPTPLRALIVTLTAVLLLAGCGGGGSSTGDGKLGGGATTASGGGSGDKTGAYQGGFEICSTGTVEEVAASYGVPESTPEAVSNSIAEAVSGGTPAYAEEAKQGCLDAFAKAK